MCGILAYYNSKGISRARLNQSLLSLKKINHRGPDGEGVTLIHTGSGKAYNLITDETPAFDLPNAVRMSEIDGIEFDLLLGHRRLSIIDVSVNGHQPMSYHGNWLTYNGEIFNYIEIREELFKLGYTFKSESDSEVILAAYEAWGENCVERFNGMYSFMIFDNIRKQLFIANDRFGVKPLYYYHQNTELLLVSELKQISTFDITTSLNKEAINVFLKDFYIDVDGETFYNEVRRFKPSHYSGFGLNKERSELKQQCYYEVKTKLKPHHDIISEFNELLESSVKLRLRSDVPVGFASSGGLDSSAILYKAYKILGASGKPDLSTFSAIFPGLAGDESPFIKLVEKDLDITSNYINPLEEFNISDFEKHIYHQDLPVHSTAHYAEFCVSRMVKSKQVKVLLTGQGGDEILGGYHHHFYRYCRQLILSGKILTYLSLLRKYAELKELEVNVLHRRIFNDVKLAVKFKLGLADLGCKMANKWNKANTLIDLLKIDLTELMLPSYLRSEDRNSMSFSVESRHPFLDYRLVDFCFSMPDDYKIRDGWQKWTLRQAMTEVPDAIRYRKDKKGYTTPQQIWIEQNKQAFEGYLGHLPPEFSAVKAADPFLKYVLGAWFKINN
jgi:asparagine synthase (glutamine-hydrolysing)